eukprot:Sdes_comp15054_c0_seq1m3832
MFPSTPKAAPVSLKEQIAFNKSKAMGTPSVSESRSCLSMTDVLKDLSKVNLRKVGERTPAKLAPVRQDPAAMIAEALKKKFSHRQKAIEEEEERGRIVNNISSLTRETMPAQTIKG